MADTTNQENDMMPTPAEIIQGREYKCPVCKSYVHHQSCRFLAGQFCCGACRDTWYQILDNQPIYVGALISKVSAYGWKELGKFDFTENRRWYAIAWADVVL
jgi:hypothetical protein